MSKFLAHWPILGPAALFLLLVLLTLGAWRLFRKIPAPACLLAAPLLGALFALAQFQIAGNYLRLWYVFCMLPSIMVFLAAGIGSLMPDGRRSPAKLETAFAILGMTAFAFLVWRPVADFARHPVQDPRGASALTRYRVEGRWHMGPSDTVTVGLYRRSMLYDPRMRQFLVVDGKKHRLRTPELLKLVLRECDENGKKLTVSMANLRFAEAKNTDYVDFVRDERYFAPLRVFPALEDYIAIETYEYKPGSLSD